MGIKGITSYELNISNKGYTNNCNGMRIRDLLNLSKRDERSYYVQAEPQLILVALGYTMCVSKNNIKSP